MTEELTHECDTCGEVEGVESECPGSKRECGHHCNHVWGHDECCWCPAVFGEHSAS